MSVIRECRDDERAAMLAIINDAANAYRGVIPPDRWHEPYMRASALDGEIAAGVKFWGMEHDGRLVGVMGIQTVRDVDLIRHAYVATSHQGHGVGRGLIEHLIARAPRPLLVGTWADATWAVEFYRRRGFELVPREETPALLRKYWTIPERQVETSVVLRYRRADS